MDINLPKKDKKEIDYPETDVEQSRPCLSDGVSGIASTQYEGRRMSRRKKAKVEYREMEKYNQLLDADDATDARKKSKAGDTVTSEKKLLPIPDVIKKEPSDQPAPGSGSDPIVPIVTTLPKIEKEEAEQESEDDPTEQIPEGVVQRREETKGAACMQNIPEENVWKEIVNGDWASFNPQLLKQLAPPLITAGKPGPSINKPSPSVCMPGPSMVKWTNRKRPYNIYEYYQIRMEALERKMQLALKKHEMNCRIKQQEFQLKRQEFHLKKQEFHINEQEFRIKEQEFRIKEQELLIKEKVIKREKLKTRMLLLQLRKERRRQTE